MGLRAKSGSSGSWKKALARLMGFGGFREWLLGLGHGDKRKVRWLGLMEDKALARLMGFGGFREWLLGLGHGAKCKVR